jgi:hypothetical protein
LLGITDETMPFKCIEDKKIKGEKGQREKERNKEERRDLEIERDVIEGRRKQKWN